MPIQSFDTWAADQRLVRDEQLPGMGRAEDGPVVGVDAVHFLERFRHPSKEPLVPALGGFPMGLEAFIEKAVREIQSVGCRLWFYFDGLDCAFETPSFGPSISAMNTVSEAFSLYETASEAAKAIERFRQSDFPDMASLIPFAKYALHKYGIPFSVAPFKAYAQMMLHLDEGAIDGVYGSSELFLYGAERIITKFNLHHQPSPNEDTNNNSKRDMEFSPERSSFSWIEREACLKALGDISPEAFADALLTAGSSYLGAFPPLLNTQPISFQHVINILTQCQFDIHRLCALYQQDEHLVQSNWEDRFMRVHVAIQNMIVLRSYDKVEPRSLANPARFGRVPSDMHEIVGLQLPEELLYYMFQGVVGPRVMNWLISGQIRVNAPLAGGESAEYRRLIKEQLQPWRQQALAQLAQKLTLYYHNKEMETLFWFGDSVRSFNMKTLVSPQQTPSSWRVRAELLAERSKKLVVEGNSARGPGSLHFAVLALKDADFAKRTISGKVSGYEPLKSAEEIIANAVWRTLVVREYVDKAHQLTPWGVVLSRALEAIGADATRDQIEAAFLSIEMLRLGLLNSDDMFSSGAPFKGTDADKKNAMLFSRLACTGKMRHPTKGYSGPLSRQLLAYHCLVAEVRAALRDLFETMLAALFLESAAERIRDDYTTLAEMLPFQENYSAGLGVIAKTYFEELGGTEDPTDVKCQSDILNRAEGWFIHIDVANSFKDACTLWQAVSAAVVGADAVTAEPVRAAWAEAGKYLAVRT